MQQLIKAWKRLQEVSSSNLATFDSICICEIIINNLKLSKTADVLNLMSDSGNNGNSSTYANLHHSGTRKIASGDNYLRTQHKLFSQQQAHFHTIPHQCFNNNKHKQTTFSMSSLAAEPLAAASTAAVTTSTPPPPASCDNNDIPIGSNGCCSQNKNDEIKKNEATEIIASASSSSEKSSLQAGLPDILKFMELIGNLKHTKRTGWVLRDVIDCESISGHMYRMSMMTFLLDGSEGLNQIRCMELALVHDLAESLVGDITPFCGVSKNDKRALEFKAMEDICKMIEPRGKRIMELFEEYENGESAESQFVKDLDRLDMVMQAFEYEKRDDCLLKHQEFFDSTRGKFKHPFVKKLIEEIYVQRDELARSKGATPPPPIQVPNMGDNGIDKNVDGTTLEKNLTPS